MLDKLRSLSPLDRSEDEEVDHTASFPLVRLLAAQLLLTTAASATREQLAAEELEGDGPGVVGRTPRPRPTRPLAAIWSPLLVGGAAAAAQLVHSVRPSEATEAAMRVLNGAVVGVSMARLVEIGTMERADWSAAVLPPLALASAGALGFLLDRETAEVEEELEHLHRRASIVERLVPKRRTKVEGVVVHV